MDHAVERELTVPETADEVWEALAEPSWLSEDAAIDLWPGGDVRAGERTGFVEEAEAPCRLAFWWSREDEEATRVEIELAPVGEGTRVRVTESRPLAVLDARGIDLGVALDVPRPGGTPELSAAGLL